MIRNYLNTHRHWLAIALLLAITVPASAGRIDTIVIQKANISMIIVDHLSFIDPPTAPEYPPMPYYQVWLFVDGIPVDCSTWCGYSENHVFDIATNATVGYISASDPLVIVDENDQVIGFLSEP